MHVPDGWLEPALHPVYARLICAELRRLGFGEAEILEGTRLSWDELHGSNLFFSFEQSRRIMLRAQELSGRPWFGLQVGYNTQLSAHGAVGYAGMAAHNVGQVLMLMQRFVELRQRVAYFEVDATEGVTLVLVERLSSPDVREYIVGHFASGLIRLLETVTGQDLRQQITIYWPFAEPGWAQDYRAFCPRSVFGADALRIEMPPALLTTPSLAPDPEAYRVALRDCERQLSQLALGTVTSRVQQRLLACNGSYPSLDQMAALEHVSSRTLIRHLQDEGVTYQRLLDSVREELACWLLLQTDLSVETIADRLGYQDTSNFSRTFRRWLGVTPRAFREATVDLGRAG
jgi:AraC-like DNA-binding protein